MYKSILVGDFKTGLKLQNMILQSKYSRLLAIRYVTQLCPLKRIPGVDSKIVLTFLERFELNEYLKAYYKDWVSQSLKLLPIMKSDESIVIIQVPTISDRAWQYLIKLALEPMHSAIFHPRQFIYSVHAAQQCLSLNLNKNSSGLQKRVLKVCFSKTIINYNKIYLMERILAPRSIKLGLARLLYREFNLYYIEDNITSVNLSNLLLDILLSDIVTLGRCIQFRKTFVFLLKPNDNEFLLSERVLKFFKLIGVERNCFSIEIVSPFAGFDYFGWHFKHFPNSDLLILPSFEDYQKLLFRVKRIINNSNYGSKIKANKLYPIIKQWKLYQFDINLISLN